MMIKWSIDSFKSRAGFIVIVTSPSRSPMYVGNQMVSGTTLQTNMAATRSQFKECCYSF